MVFRYLFYFILFYFILFYSLACYQCHTPKLKANAVCSIGLPFLYPFKHDLANYKDSMDQEQWGNKCMGDGGLHIMLLTVLYTVRQLYSMQLVQSTFTLYNVHIMCVKSDYIKHYSSLKNRIKLL